MRPIKIIGSIDEESKSMERAYSTMGYMRYPDKGLAKAKAGEDLLAGRAHYVSHIELTATKEIGVLVNGKELKGRSDFLTNRFIYTTTSTISDLSGKYGGIDSLIVESETEYFLIWAVFNQPHKRPK